MPTFVSMSSTSVDIQTTNRNFVGDYNLVITGYLLDGSAVSLPDPNFTVEMYNSCNQTAIV